MAGLYCIFQPERSMALAVGLYNCTNSCTGLLYPFTATSLITIWSALISPVFVVSAGSLHLLVLPDESRARTRTSYSPLSAALKAAETALVPVSHSRHAPPSIRNSRSNAAMPLGARGGPPLPHQAAIIAAPSIVRLVIVAIGAVRSTVQP